MAPSREFAVAAAVGAAALAALVYSRRQRLAKAPRAAPDSLAAFDSCVEDLHLSGVATLHVSLHTEQVHARSLAVARVGLDNASFEGHPLAISPDADSAHASGVHAAGALSQVGAFRLKPKTGGAGVRPILCSTVQCLPRGAGLFRRRYV